MMNLLDQPWIRFVTCFLIFVAIGLLLDATNPWAVVPALTGLTSTGYALLRRRILTSSHTSNFEELSRIGCLLLAFFLACMVLCLHRFMASEQDELAHRIGDRRVEAEIDAVVLSAPAPNRFGWLIELGLISIDDESLSHRQHARVSLFYPVGIASEGDTLALNELKLPLPGDIVRGFIRMEQFEAAQVPNAVSMLDVMGGRGFSARANTQETLEVIGKKRSLWMACQRALARKKLSFEARVRMQLEDDAAAIALAMLTASRGLIRPEFRDAFDVTGTSHLIAISGLHLGVLAALLWALSGFFVNWFPGLLSRFGRRRLSGLFVVLVLSSYVLMIGAPTSACRALMMVSLTVVALVCMRPFCSLHALATGAFLLTLWRPPIVMELGFQLSFAATLGILLFLRAMPEWLRKPPYLLGDDSWRAGKVRALGIFVLVSVSATLFTWPVIVLRTGELPIAGLWLNLFVVPIVSVCVFPLLVAGTIVAQGWEYGGFLIIEFAAEIMLLMQLALADVALWPGSTWRWGIPHYFEWLCMSLGIFFIILRGYRYQACVVGAVILSLSVAPAILSSLIPEKDNVRVHFIPVGQGDATLIELPDQQTVLIDAGGQIRGRDPGLSIVLPYLKRLGIRQLDWVILTHAHHDHMGGLDALVPAFRPKNFIFDAGEHSFGIKKLTKTMQRWGTELVPVKDEYSIETGTAHLQIIRPGIGPHGSKNDRSLVTTLRFGKSAVMLPGDIERASEQWLVDQQRLHTVTVMKVPHHGSKTSSTESFLDKTRPRIGIISAGRFNRFGHPHEQVLERYAQRSTKILRTDVHGLITLDVEKEGEINVRTMHP